MRVSLEGGSRFSEAASEHPELFPGYSVEILRSAELTGNLDEVLDQLSDYLEREIETEHKVKSALADPSNRDDSCCHRHDNCVVLVICVLPKFKTFFASLNAKLQLPTANAAWPSPTGLEDGAVLLLSVVLGVSPP